MLKDNRIWVANNAEGENIFMLPSMANRHGLVSGATGTGKTVTLKVLAETFSEMGVPVFMADVKGDIAGLMNPGTDTADMQKRIERFKLAEAGFEYTGYPVTFWDVYGKNGIQLRTTVSEMGPLLLSRILGLNDTQTDILSVVFKIADDNDLLLIDTKDLKSLLAYVDRHANDFAEDYGKISSASVGVITRSIVALESIGGDTFFAEPGLDITDWINTDGEGRGMIHVLDCSSLINNGKLYSTFLLWMLSELFETMPEVGDPEKPKLVFFFDEAHLLFKDAQKALLEKIEQVVKLIRSKGIGIYFCTQNPRDIPNGVLAQLNNKIQHGLRAYTPSDQKAVRAAAESFRINPKFKTYDEILNLGTGEAIVSFLDERGIPGVAEKAYILPPRCSFGAVADEERAYGIYATPLYGKYAESVDNESAYETITQINAEQQQAAEEAKKKEKEEKGTSKKKTTKKSTLSKTAKTTGSTLGREAGKLLGSNFGSLGKKLGGNLGSTLGRGLLETLFGKSK
ncbi:MAG: DUF853 family protein [Clostridia bacterium]|nr:DUF853 family protein [Clostridia bacterium]